MLCASPRLLLQNRRERERERRRAGEARGVRIHTRLTSQGPYMIYSAPEYKRLRNGESGATWSDGRTGFRLQMESSRVVKVTTGESYDRTAV